MSAGDKVEEIVKHLPGMEWPDGDEGELRNAAKAWRSFADSIEDVTAAVNGAAGSLIHHNKGVAIDAFADPFWRRYYHDKSGWLQDLIDGAGDMAKALDAYADSVADAKKELEHKLEIVGATIVAGTALAIFTAGISEAAAAAASVAIVDLAGTLGVALSAEVATIAGTTLASAAMAGIESVAVDLAVTQPVSISTGVSKGFSLDEVKSSALYGMEFGGAFGAGAGAARATADAGGIPALLSNTYDSSAGLRLAHLAADTPRAGASLPSSTADEWLTGARRRPRDILDDPAQTRWAEDAYSDFMKDPRDVAKIVENSRGVARSDGSTGFTPEEISAVKKHVFDTEHPIEDYETGEVVIRKFDADAEIADAWIRLRAGRALPEDHILLQHEITELTYLREHPGATYQEAHRVTNQQFNWESRVPLSQREDFESEW